MDCGRRRKENAGFLQACTEQMYCWHNEMIRIHVLRIYSDIMYICSFRENYYMCTQKHNARLKPASQPSILSNRICCVPTVQNDCYCYYYAVLCLGKFSSVIFYSVSSFIYVQYQNFYGNFHHLCFGLERRRMQIKQTQMKRWRRRQRQRWRRRRNFYELHSCHTAYIRHSN